MMNFLYEVKVISKVGVIGFTTYDFFDRSKAIVFCCYFPLYDIVFVAEFFHD